MEVCLYRLQDGSCSLMGDPSIDEVVLRFSTCYGFKNIQLLVQQLSSNTTRQGDISHFVEVMACPGGCINGGGLAKASTVMKGLRERPSEMRQRIENTRVHLRDSTGWIAGDMEKGMLNDTVNLTHTRFHVVPKLELSTGATAGVKVDDTQW
jgi:iron only hydrogenase large subunit-like protein